MENPQRSSFYLQSFSLHPTEKTLKSPAEGLPGVGGEDQEQ